MGYITPEKTRFAIGKRSSRGIWVDSKSVTAGKIEKNGHNSRDTHRTVFSFRYSESASKNTPSCRIWAFLMQLQNFNLFRQKFKQKFRKKINFVVRQPNWVGRCIFWRWFRISKLKNRMMCVTWVIANFSDFLCRYALSLDPNTPRSWFAANFYYSSKYIKTSSLRSLW